MSYAVTEGTFGRRSKRRRAEEERVAGRRSEGQTASRPWKVPGRIGEAAVLKRNGLKLEPGAVEMTDRLASEHHRLGAPLTAVCLIPSTIVLVPGVVVTTDWLA
ncbi:unnamed protein product [Lampetra planeri]